MPYKRDFSFFILYLKFTFKFLAVLLSSIIYAERGNMTKEKIVKVISDKTPQVIIRVIGKDDDKVLVKHKKKFPFKLHNTVNYTVETTHRVFSFRIYQGYSWNGADIPKPLWWVGQSKDNAYLTASLVHDFLLEYKKYIYNIVLDKKITPAQYRRLTSLIFREILKQDRTNVIKANIMAASVDWYQKYINRREWEI